MDAVTGNATGLPRSSWRLGLEPTEGVQINLSPATASPVTLAPKLGVPGTEIEDMPLLLRTFFRLLYSWEHRPLSCSG